MDLEKNFGSNERTVRLLVGVLIMTIGIASVGFTSFFGFILTLIGAFLTGTGIVNHCPAYKKFDIKPLIG